MKRKYQKKIITITFCILFLFQCGRDKNEKWEIEKLLVGSAYLNSSNCSAKLAKSQNNRVYQTSFEDINDFQNSYIVPQNYQNAATHGLSSSVKKTGTYSHAGTVYAKGPNCSYPANCNHRGYPTIQFYKMSQGSFRTPVTVELNVYLQNWNFQAGEWFSFATFSADESDSWSRVVLINLSDTNFVHLMHVPNQGQGIWTYQNKNLGFTQNSWVKISACLDLGANGFAKVRQDDVLVSEANVSGGCGTLEQAHFGLYAPPSISAGTVYNDDLIIKEVSSCSNF